MAKTEKKVNYTSEMVQTALSMYEGRGDAGNDVLEEIAAKLDRTVRSVRAKLVREGVYVPTPKGAATPATDKGPSKKEMLQTLRGLAPVDFGDNLNGATKSGIAILIELFTPQPEGEVQQIEDFSEAESEAESEAVA